MFRATKEDVAQHTETEHAGEVPPHHCYLCNFTFSKKSGFERHKASIHGGNINSKNGIARYGNSHRKVACIDLDKLDEQIDSMMEESGNKINTKGRDYNYTLTVMICKMCGKEAQRGDIKNHIEAIHITGVEQKCDLCCKISSTRNGLRQHKAIHHKPFKSIS